MDTAKYVALADGTQIPFIEFNIENNVGHPPLFLDNSISGYYLLMENDFESLLNLIMPFSKPQLAKLSPQTIDNITSKLCFETTFDMLELDPEKFQRKIKDYSNFDIPWALTTPDHKYRMGRNLENMVLASVDRSYFSFAVQTRAAFIKFQGFYINGRFEVNRPTGYSIQVNPVGYQHIFNKDQIGPTEMSRFFIDHANPDLSKTIPVEYFAGVWNRYINESEHTAQDQPSLGLFKIKNNVDYLSQIIREFRIPSLSHDGQLVIPINYGVFSAVSFIDRTSEMVIKKAHNFDNIYSLSAIDVKTRDEECQVYDFPKD